MEGMCTGCAETKFVVEYINNGHNKGNYCIECMCCPECGEVLPPDRVASMQSVYIPKRNKKPGNKMVVSRPAKGCSSFTQPIAEEWDVQP